MSASDWGSWIDDVRRAQTSKGRRTLGAFACEGARLVSRAVAAEYPLRVVLVSDRVLRAAEGEEAAALDQLRQAGAPLQKVPEGVLLELSAGRNSGRMIALCELPANQPLEEIALGARERRRPVLVLVDVEEPGNLGALVRTALGADAAAVICVGRCDPFHAKAVRTSMGSIFRIPLAWGHEAEGVFEHLASLQNIAAVSQGGEPPWVGESTRATAVWLGSEAEGLPEGVVRQCQRQVSIPMPTGIDSYSINAAAAVLLYEFGLREPVLEA